MPLCPAMELAWENLQKVFAMLVVVVVFTSLEVFTFTGYFLCHWHSTLASAFTSYELYPGYFWVFYFCQAFPSHFYRERYGWVGIFYPQVFFYLTLHILHIFDTFCYSDEGRNAPSRLLLCVCPQRVVPSRWRMDLSYSYCSYKTIDLSIAPVSHKL